MDYMTYAYLQLARDGDARKTFDEARTITGTNQTVPTAASALAAMPARYVLERGAWRDAAQLQIHDSGLHPGRSTRDHTNDRRALHLRRGAAV